MAVTSVQEVWTDRGGVVSGTDDTDVRQFLAITNNLQDNAKTVELSGLIPSRFSAHPTKNSIFADEIDIKQHPKSGYWWNVRVTYRRITGMPSLPVREFQPNPLLRRRLVTGHSVIANKDFSHGYPVGTYYSTSNKTVNIAHVTEKTLNSDYGGRHAAPVVPEFTEVQTSAGEPQVGLQDIDVHFIWQFTFNVYPLPTWIVTFPGTINSDAVVIQGLLCRQRTLRFMGLTLSDIQEEVNNLVGAVPYYTVGFQLHYKRDTWLRPIADRGKYKRDSNFKLVEMIDPKGKPFENPVFLDGEGAPLGAAAALTEAAQVRYGWWLPQIEQPFAPLLQ